MTSKRLYLPRTLPAYLEVGQDDFIRMDIATTAQWRVAYFVLDNVEITQRERTARRREIRRVLRIADAIGAAEDQPLWPLIHARVKNQTEAGVH
jgi:hypothetical protein